MDKKKILKTFTGKVVSNKNDKTIVVLVDSIKVDPKYKKQFKVSRKYMVHDEKNEYNVGDKAIFVACRPISSSKKWRVIKKG